MKTLAILLLSLLAALAPAQDEDAAPVRFTTVELVLDSGADDLAAWQVEVTDASGRARIVGIEGGEHPAFREPARYDPQALAGGRIVLAAFSLDANLPSGSTHVATLHLEVRGDGPVPLAARVQAAADAEGNELAPTSTLREDD